jgi:hypothetical protein
MGAGGSFRVDEAGFEVKGTAQGILDPDASKLD